jgi:hypothetical protein
MSSSTLQFISQVKLGALRQQRNLLIDAYDQALRESAGRWTTQNPKPAPMPPPRPE